MNRSISLKSLGKNGPNISILGYGCLQLSSPDAQEVTNENKKKLIQRAFFQGVNFFDTAATYGLNRHNEKLLGEAISELNRREVIVATKCGIDFYSTNKFPQKPEEIRQSVNESLKNLATNYIDILYLHRIDPKATNDQFIITIAAMKQLVQEGKVKFLGISEPTASQILIASQVEPVAIPITTVEIAYSIFTRRAEKNGVMNVCKDLGIGIVAYTSVIRGFSNFAILNNFDQLEIETMSVEKLQKKVFQVLKIENNPFETSVGFYDLNNIRSNLAAMFEFQQIARALNLTPTQLSLAWLIHKGIFPIPGTKNEKHLDENNDAAQVILEPTVLNMLDEKFYQDRFLGNPNPKLLEAFDNNELEFECGSTGSLYQATIL